LRFLLDENFPLQLYRRLLETGHQAEHVIELGQRGVPDTFLRDRLVAEELVLLTQDTEFENLPSNCSSQVIVSRVPQRLPIRERVEIWTAALGRFSRERRNEKLFDLLPSGEIVAWEVVKSAEGTTVRRTTRRF